MHDIHGDDPVGTLRHECPDCQEILRRNKIEELEFLLMMLRREEDED